MVSINIILTNLHNEVILCTIKDINDNLQKT